MLNKILTGELIAWEHEKNNIQTWEIFVTATPLYSQLNFAWWNRWHFVESSRSWSFTRNFLKGIVNKGVHDLHGFCRNTNIWMDLLQDFLNIAFITFLSCCFSFGKFSRAFLSISTRFWWCFLWTSSHN